MALNKIAALKSKIRFSLIVTAVINIVTISLNLYPVVQCYTTYSGVLETSRKKNIYMIFSFILKIVKQSKCIVDLYLCPWYAAHVRPTFCCTVKA